VGIVIGIDEAGLGPNLGPLVVTATVWEVPGSAAEFDFWSGMAASVSSDPQSSDGRLVIADSKVLFQPHHGLARLERSVLALLAAAGITGKSLRELCSSWQPHDDWASTPWLQHADVTLPSETTRDAVRRGCEHLMRAPARLKRVWCRIVGAAEFNRLLDTGNKSDVVTGCHLELLQRACAEFDGSPILVQSDKHGGRNRYAAALSNRWDGDWVETVCESSDQSVYRVGAREIRFEPRAERHLPVAAASMISKYIRELHMDLFNRFWRRHLPDLTPTQGYPVDARRFADAIEPVRARLEIPRENLWRRK